MGLHCLNLIVGLALIAQCCFLCASLVFRVNSRRYELRIKTQHLLFTANPSPSLNFRAHRPILSSRLQMTQIAEFGDEDFDDTSSKTQSTKPKTHGYEGDFLVGDRVKIVPEIRIWSVKQYSKEGFLAKGFTGTITGMDLFGRKYGTLCSAITPIKVEFQPDDEGIPKGMFERKWAAHFSAAELELLSRPQSAPE